MSEEEEILENAEKMFQRAVSGYRTFRSSEGREKIDALLDVPTYGRASTRTLHQLKSHDEGFEEWWEERREVLESDPICDFMWELRNDILKVGKDNVSSIHQVSFHTDELPPTPDWADHIFIRDQFGGDGYAIEGPDGEETKVYVDFDLDNVNTTLYFEDLEETIEEQDWGSSTVEEVLVYYLQIIGEIVSDAKVEFGEH